MANRLYVGNLPYSVTEADMVNFFASAGKVEKAIIVTDRDTGKPRGFGFVDMASDDEAKKAIETFNGAELQGRVLIVNEAKPKEDRRPSGQSGYRPPSHQGPRNFGGGNGGGRPKFDDNNRRRGGGWREDRRRNNRQGGFEED